MSSRLQLQQQELAYEQQKHKEYRVFVAWLMGACFVVNLLMH